MSTGLLKIVKQAASEAEDNAKPTELRYGTVVAVNPLKVQVTNQFTLPASVLIVPRQLTDYTVRVTTESETPGEGTESTENTESTNGASTESTMTIHNALRVGEKVALIRQRGGQSYFILDRI